MIFSTCTVSFSEIINNKERMRLLEECLNQLQGKVDLVTFPAGFLGCETQTEMKQYLANIKDLSNHSKLHIALGIDCQDFGSSSQLSLPYFGVLATPDKPIRVWRDRLYKQSAKGEIHLSSIVESRSICLKGINIEIIACGDLFNRAFLDDIIKRDIDIGIALVHTASGSRVLHALKYLATNGVHGFSSLHAKVKGAVKYGYLSTKKQTYENISSRESDFLIRGFNQVEIKIWEV